MNFSTEIDYIGLLSGQISIGGYFTLHIYLLTHKILIHNSLYIFDKWGKIQAIKRCTITVRKCLPEGSS